MSVVKAHMRKTRGKISSVKTHPRKGREKKIMSFYKKAGVPSPEGRGIHSVAFHKRATTIMASMKRSGKPVNKNMAYAIAMRQLGASKAVMTKHRRQK